MNSEGGHQINLYSRKQIGTPERVQGNKNSIYRAQSSLNEERITSGIKAGVDPASSAFAAPNSTRKASTASQIISRRKNQSMSNMCIGVQKIKKENEQLKKLLMVKKEDRSMALDMYKLLLQKLYALNKAYPTSRK